MADTLPDGVLQAPDYPAISDAWIIELTEKINEILNKESLELVTADEWNNIHNVLVTVVNHNAGLTKVLADKLKQIIEEQVLSVSVDVCASRLGTEDNNVSLEDLVTKIELATTVDNINTDLGIIRVQANNNTNNVEALLRSYPINTRVSSLTYEYTTNDIVLNFVIERNASPAVRTFNYSVSLREAAEYNGLMNLSKACLVFYVPNNTDEVDVKVWAKGLSFNDLLAEDKIKNSQVVALLDVNTNQELKKKWNNPAEKNVLLNNILDANYRIIPNTEEGWLILNQYKDNVLGTTLVDRLSIGGIQALLSSVLGISSELNRANSKTDITQNHTYAEFKVGDRTLLLQWGEVEFPYKTKECIVFTGTTADGIDNKNVAYLLDAIIEFPVKFQNSESFYVNVIAVSDGNTTCSVTSTQGNDLEAGKQVKVRCTRSDYKTVDTRAYWFAIGWKD